MPAPTPSRSQALFSAASPDLRALTKKIVGYERQVQHMKNRVLPGQEGLGIHQAILIAIRDSVK